MVWWEGGARESFPEKKALLSMFSFHPSTIGLQWVQFHNSDCQSIQRMQSIHECRINMTLPVCREHGVAGNTLASPAVISQHSLMYSLKLYLEECQPLILPFEFCLIIRYSPMDPPCLQHLTSLELLPDGHWVLLVLNKKNPEGNNS